VKKINYLWIGLIFLLISFFYDKQIILAITQLRLTWLNDYMIWITNRMTIIMLFIIVSTIFLWKEHKRNWILPLWASAGTAIVLTKILKIIIGRTRPFEALSLPLIEGLKYSFGAWNTSFPSMHAATVFAALPILNKEFPKLRWFWVILAIFIAFSRLYVGVHYLSDIIAGTIIGLVIGYQIIKLEKKVLKKWNQYLWK